MAKNIEINVMSNNGEYEILYPKTLSSLIDGVLTPQQGGTGFTTLSALGQVMAEYAPTNKNWGVSVTQWIGTKETGSGITSSNVTITFPGYTNGKTVKFVYLLPTNVKHYDMSEYIGKRSALILGSIYLNTSASIISTEYNNVQCIIQRVFEQGTKGNYANYPVGTIEMGMSHIIWNDTLFSNNGFTVLLKEFYNELDNVYTAFAFYY